MSVVELADPLTMITGKRLDLLGLEPVAEVGLGGPGGLEIYPSWYSRQPYAPEVSWTAGDEPPKVWIVDRLFGFDADGAQVWEKVFPKQCLFYSGQTITARLS